MRASRGNVFDFIESDGSKSGKMFLVVSPDFRSLSRMVSGCMLGTKQSSWDDETWLSGDFEGYVIHAGLVTFARRTQLGEFRGQIKPEEMESILYDIRIQLIGESEENNDSRS